jgi:hypothetical protein
LQSRDLSKVTLEAGGKKPGADIRRPRMHFSFVIKKAAKTDES